MKTSSNGSPLENMPTDQKQALLAKLLAEQTKRRAANQLIEAPLSPTQRRLWILSRINPSSAGYNMMYAHRLQGSLYQAALERALTQMQHRHESLRTHFRDSATGPMQCINPQPRVGLERLRLRPGNVAALLEQAHRQIIAATTTPFDLEAGPPWRALLLELGADDHILAVIQHHIITDNWSYRLFYEELERLYRGDHLPALELQYRLHVAREREADQARLNKQIDYWLKQLGDLRVTELLADEPRPAEESYRGAVHIMTLPFAHDARARQLATSARATSHMFYLAVFHCLLHRHTDERDINCGVPVANRHLASVKGLIGFFTNTLVMRTNFSGEPTFLELLEQVRRTSLEAYSNPEAPFEVLVERLRPERDLSRNPLYQIIFQEAMGLGLKLDGLLVEDAFLMDYGLVRCDLEFYLRAEQGQFHCSIVYNRDLYKPMTIAALARRFSHLLEQVLEQPTRPVSQLSLLDPLERASLLVDWNATAREFPAESVWQGIARQVSSRGAAIALIAGERQLTYGQLAQRAQYLAAQLRARGAGPGQLVAVCLPRGAAMVEALLATWLCGAAYVPMDPSFPAERLGFMLEDAKPRVMVGRGDSGPALTFAGAFLDLADDTVYAAAPWSGAPPQGEDLAYVIFTSGSTGRPKGVQVTMGALTNFLFSMAEKPGLGADDVLVAVTTLSFDIAALELYLPLTQGARLVIASRETAADGAALAALLDTSGATVMQATPATWRMLLEAGWAGSAGLKALCGGEALPAELARILAARTASLWNMYGPTETTIWSAVSRVAPESDPAVPMGHPIANTGIYVLDHHLRPLPLGVPGELAIGGLGLARGYLDQPALTAAKFVPDPFASSAGARLYRTGDQVRFLRDDRGTPHSLAFLGRFDHQIKLRGYRIELTDIEAKLAQHPEVANAVVCVRAAEEQLVAHVVAANATPPSLRHLRAYMAERLPGYMVPVAYVFHEHFPLTPNGKIDRKALAAVMPELRHFGKEETSAHALDQTEELVAGIWSTVLGVPGVTAQADFFALGGHSLLATQMLGRLREALGLELPLRSLFEAPTLGAFCKQLGHSKGRAALEAPAVTAIARDGELPLSITQQRLWFLDQLQPNNPTYNMPFVIELRGALQVGVLKRALAALFERHEVLRSHYPTWDDRAHQVIAPPAPPRLPVIDLSGLAAHERDHHAQLLARRDALRTFKLDSDLLLRFTLLRLEGQCARLLVNVHHIVSDAWSLGIMVREISLFYQAFAKGEEPALQPLVIQYADFAAWQHRYLDGDRLAPQLAYWKARLAAAPPLHQLHTDFPRPPKMTNNGAHHTFWVEEAETSALQRLCREQVVTLHMALLAIYLVLLQRLSGQDDLSLGTTVANRSRPELEPLMGFFVNTLVLRNDLAGDPSFTELLARVRRTTLEAYDHQDVTFEQVVEAVSPKRDPAYSPLFQLLFEVQTVTLESAPIEGVALALFEEDHVTAKFDLSVSFRDTGGRLLCFFEYNTDLFTETTIAGMAKQLLTLMGEILADPGQAISTYALADASERAAWAHQLADDFDDLY